MQVQQRRWTRQAGWQTRSGPTSPIDASLVLVFGGSERLAAADWNGDLSRVYPGAHVVSMTTAGEVSGTEVTDDSVVATAVSFDSTRLEVVAAELTHRGESYDVGAALGRALPPEGLRHVLVFSEGLLVNGSALARGLREHLPAGVGATGGLAADGARMRRTLVGLDELPREGRIALVGLYGASLECRFGSQGGWDPFGPERRVTRSAANVVYELDGRSALSLYREYLGEHAAGLPSTGLLFPLALLLADGRTLVRTLLSIDESAESVTFAGDVPEGSIARLMHASFDRLVDGALVAGRRASQREAPGLALLVSCVGRKLVLGPRAEEEVEAVRDALGPDTTMAGFYSNGELCPFADRTECELHNQTMTVTTFTEHAR